MKSKRIVSLTLILIICMQFIIGLQIHVQPVKAEELINQSRMLKVKGNKIVLADNEMAEVILTGVNVPGGEWTHRPDVEKVMRSTIEAINNWDCNLIRLCVSSKGWYGQLMGNWQPSDGGLVYRQYIDSVINEISKAGKYVIIDLHEYGIFYTQQVNFWTEVSVKYKNNPTVLFGILNEPKGINWDIWRNGDGDSKIGHQKVVETIRNLGAKNIIVAGGISYSNDLRGVVGQSGDGINYALIDQGFNGDTTKTGNGIMYDLHMYPWHGGVQKWDTNAGEARRQYPILMGEFGWSADLNLTVGNKVYNPGDQRYHDKWLPEIFEWMNDVDQYGNYLNWTAFSLHRSALPLVKDIGWADENYSYPPTEYFGVYVKEELKKRLGQNVALGKTATSSIAPPDNLPTKAFDGDKETFWFSSLLGEKYIVVDLAAVFLVNRWIVSHSPISIYRTVDFQLQTSIDGENWTEVDAVTNNQAVLTDLFFTPTQARYIRLSISKGSASGNSSRIHEFSVMGKDINQATQITPPETVNGNELIQISSIKFLNQSINCNDGLKTGKTDVELRLTNSDNAYSNDVLLFVAMFKKNKLVSIDMKKVNLSPNMQTQPHWLSVTMPDMGNVSDYYIKVSVWKNAVNINPISHIMQFDENGIN